MRGDKIDRIKHVNSPRRNIKIKLLLESDIKALLDNSKKQSVNAECLTSACLIEANLCQWEIICVNH